jgi:putative hydrolase of the HAD superfamily
VLLSLDDTLLDRARAFRGWGQEFLQQIGASPYDLEWLLSVDADGMASYWDIAEAVLDRYHIRAPAIELVDYIRFGVLDRLRLDPLLACALRIARDAGLRPFIITNGDVAQQETKLRKTGLDRQVAGWVISEEVGVRKPNPRIFAIAADRARMRLENAWMIGDSPEADIRGAAEIGIRSVWLHRGRPWQESRFAPTRTADSAIAALSIVMAARSAAPRR